MSSLRIETAEIFEPLLSSARDKGAWGGRGSGKSHFFAGLMVEDALRFPGEAGEGLRGICGREIQKSLKDSAKYLIESKIAEFGLGERDGFKVFNDRIVTPGDGLIVFQGLQDHTTDSIKSFEGFHRFWGEEAHSISERSIGLIRPTIRWEDVRRGLKSELWWSWNPLRKVDAVDRMLRGQELRKDTIVVRANWSDNPWFPAVLDEERLECLRLTPDQYDHIWEGGYATVLSGAYYANLIVEARRERRIGNVARDPLLPVRAFWDIGVRDATSIWIAQWVGREIRVIDYYEAVGQPLAVHLDWLRSNGYGNATCILPHDAAQHDVITATRFEDHISAAGFETETIPNQGKGAAMKRIEAVRRLFPSIWFDEKRCEGGIDALGWYHEKIDDKRDIGLGPEHDWSSHAADAFGLMCVAYEAPNEHRVRSRYSKSAPSGKSWMAA